MALNLRRRSSPVPSPPMRAASGLTVAAGARIDVSDRTQMAAYRKRMSGSLWQESAGVFNAVVGEIGFGHDYVRDSLARVRIVPAILSDDPDAPPIPVDQDTAPPGLSADLCDQLVQRLAPFPNFMGQSAWKTDIWGECFCALIPDDDEIDGERCQVFSYREIITSGDQWRIRRFPSDSVGYAIDPNAPFWRLWQPDPEFGDLPFSHMIRLALPAERLMILSRLVKAFALSRIATTGKLLAIADEFDLESATGDFQAPTEDAGNGEGMTSTFFDDFMDAGAAAILDPESASAVMNLIVRGPHELIKDGISVIDISRTMEEVMLKLRDEAREEIATGINLPREIILGVGATNHWNAEEIKEQAWLNHLEPRAYNILAGTTTAYYRPALLANGVDRDIVRRCVLHYDPVWFLGEPDRADSADYGYDNMLLSGEAWRLAKNWSADDAPDDEEIKFRISTQQALNVRTTIRDDASLGGPEPATVEDNATNPDPNPDNNPEPPPATPDKTAPAEPSTETAPTPPGPKPKAAKKAKVASGAPSLDRLGHRQVGIERDLRTALLHAADPAVGRVLERAGMTVRNKLASRSAGQSGKAMLTLVKDIPAAEIPALIGRAAVEAFGLTEHELLVAALGDLETKYYLLVRRAQHAAFRTAAAATGSPADYDALDEATDDDRKAGWAILSAGLMGLAAAALYNPHPDAPAVGEFDESTLVPAGLIRAALDRAGGAQEGRTRTIRGAEIPTPLSPVSGAQDAPGGATGGPTMLDVFQDELGITADGYVWVYGDAPRKEFEPHLDLDGEAFTGWDDDVLANPGDWPDYDYLFPGDHAGCCCDSAVQYTQAGETTTLEPGAGVDVPAPPSRSEKADALDQPRPERK